MAKILSTKSTFTLKIDDLKFTLKPLNYMHRLELDECFIQKGGSNLQKLYRSQSILIKYSLKSVKGIKNHDDSDYELEFNDDGSLTDDCVNDIMNIQQRHKLTTAAMNVLNGVMEMSDDITQGIELEFSEGK